MQMTRRKQLGEILIEAGLITTSTLKRALERQKTGKKRLGAVLHEMGVITEGELRDFLAKQFDLKVIKDIATRQIARGTLDLIPVDLAIQKLLFPLMTHNGILALAVTDPLDCNTIDYVAKKAAIRVMPILATQSTIMAGIVRHYLDGRKVPKDNLTVLVVEDSQPVAALIRSALEKDSYRVVVGHDGIEGIKLALAEQPDLVICDSIMPRMDGFALLRALKGNEATATIPIILLTSKGTPEHEQDALSAGFFDFVSKPVHPVRISARVRRAFEMLDIG
jgi:CheY-like chemotaxis protein